MSNMFRALFVSDWHVPRHEEPFLQAVTGFTREVKVDLLVPGGDLSDMAPAGRFDAEEDDPAGLLEEMSVVSEFIRGMRAKRKVVLEGNHEYRLRKMLVGRNARVLRGLLNQVSVENLYRQAGLPPSVEWFVERVGHPGLVVGTGQGRTLFRHGDRQSGRYAPANPCKRALDQNPGINQVFGHLHRCGIHCLSSLGRMWWAMASGTAAKKMNYSRGGDPDWQAGCSMVEWPSGLGGVAVPTPILAQPDGSFLAHGQIWRP